jgi:hypothetical protein
MGFGGPRLGLLTHIVLTAFTLLYRRHPVNIPEDGANLASGIKSQGWESYLRWAEFEAKFSDAWL